MFLMNLSWLFFFLCWEFNQSLTMGQNSFVKQSQTSLSRTLREKRRKKAPLEVFQVEVMIVSLSL